MGYQQCIELHGFYCLIHMFDSKPNLDFPHIEMFTRLTSHTSTDCYWENIPTLRDNFLAHSSAVSSLFLVSRVTVLLRAAENHLHDFSPFIKLESPGLLFTANCANVTVNSSLLIALPILLLLTRSYGVFLYIISWPNCTSLPFLLGNQCHKYHCSV